MKIETLTRAHLDRKERETIIRALVHIRIAYPDYDERSAKENRNDPNAAVCRALNRVAQGGEPLDHDLVTAVLTGFNHLAEVCAEQADLPYWRDQLQLGREEKAGVQAVAGTGGIPLVGNPEDFCLMLAETREWQLVEVDAARDLLREVLEALER
jgi:hypothetical protein